MLITPYHQLQGPLGLFQMILASSPIWLLGTSLVRPWPIFRFSFLQALILFSSIPLFARAGVAVYFHNFMVSLLIFPLFWVLTAPSRRQTTLPVPGWIWIVVGVCYGCGAALFLWTTPIGRGPMLVYISLPILIAVLGAFWKLFGPARFEILGLASFSLVLGRMSYAIYLIHNPIITVMQSFMHDVRLELVVDVTTAFALAALLEYIWQPWAAHLFDRVWTMEPKKHMAVENAPEG
jgi:peptidoglycan/LPS O-acetylase OafA/YrhL